MAREAVAADYGRRGVRVSPERIAITASSSESYSLLFKLLCDPGDSVLVPAPSYPLFEHLAALDAVPPVQTYRLEDHGTVDLGHRRPRARDSTTARGRCSRRQPQQSDGVDAHARRVPRFARVLCVARPLALVGDEVFCDYPFARRVLMRPRACWRNRRR